MLAHDRLGSGSPLVLLHGLGGASTEWRLVERGLAERHEVIAFDLPGHGGTGGTPTGEDATPGGLARAVAGSLDALGLARVHLAGTSLGGWVAFELAALGRACSVTGFAPAGLWDPADCRGVAPDGLAGLRRLVRLAGPVLPPLTRIRPLARAATRVAVAHPERLAHQTIYDAAQALAVAIGYREILHRLPGRHLPPPEQVSCPVTVVFGEQDRRTPPWRSFDLLPPQTRVDVWADVGHMVVWDAPARAVRLVLSTTALHQCGRLQHSTGG